MQGANQTTGCCDTDELNSLDKLIEYPNRPRAMEHFDRLIREGLRQKDLEVSSPVVGYWCNFVPDELVMAASAVPIRLDLGCDCLPRAADQLMPRDVCCVVRANAGAELRSVWQYEKADLLVTPTSCDGKKKLATRLSEKREVHVLSLPPFDRGDRSVSWWFTEINLLVNRLQKLTGKRISRRSLKSAIELVNHRSQLLRQLNALRMNACLPISGADAFLVMQSSFFADCSWWIEKTESLIEELQKRVSIDKGVKPKARILLTGSPILWPDYRLLFMLSDVGAEVVADELCSGTQRLYHPTVVDEWTREGMIRAAAERVLLPCTCPCFSESDARWDRLCELIDQYKVDGVVHHTLRLCQLYDTEAMSLSSKLIEKGLPVLQIQSELGIKDDGRLRNRVEAFVEIITDR